MTRCIPRLPAAGVLLVFLLTACGGEPPEHTSPETGDDYDALVAIFDEFRALRAPPPADDGHVDDRPGAVAERIERLTELQRRLDAIDTDGWDRAREADHLAVRAQLDELEFVLRVTRPWARDPVYYVNRMLRLAFTELPAEGEALETLQRALRTLPALVDQATANLTDITRDHGELAIFHLTTSDGVGFEHPERDTPPPGVIGWYDDLLGRAGNAQPELVDDIISAREAVEDFHDWLVTRRDDFAGDNGVGEALFDWYLHHGLLIPHTSAEILEMAERELERVEAFHALERERNRGLPEIELARSEEEYLQRIADTDAWIRDWLVAEDFISIPEFIPDDWQDMGFNVPWVDRGTPPNFWEQVQYRDPAPDHLHAVIPGHRYDVWFERQSEHPIRRHIRDGVRYQGWAVYLEETPLQLGLFDQRPRTRELIYTFLQWRAARTIGDILNQHNVMSAPEVIDWWVARTQWMDENVARSYAYLRPHPGHGLHYTYGHLQMRQLLTDYRLQQGDDFVLRDFHDRFMAAERIPLSLIRYEMTGLDDEVRELRTRVPLTELLD